VQNKSKEKGKHEIKHLTKSRRKKSPCNTNSVQYFAKSKAKIKNATQQAQGVTGASAAVSSSFPGGRSPSDLPMATTSCGHGQWNRDGRL
jgi:hypothetical protein